MWSPTATCLHGWVLSQEGSSHKQQLTPIGASTSKGSGEAAYKNRMAERELSSRGIPGAAQAQLLLLHRIRRWVQFLHTARPSHLDQSVGGGAFAVVATILHQSSCWEELERGLCRQCPGNQ